MLCQIAGPVGAASAEAAESRAGVATEATGETIAFSAIGGKHGSRTWQAAERDLLRKIHHYNSKKRGRYRARVAFAPGDADRVMRLGAEKGNVFEQEDWFKWETGLI